MPRAELRADWEAGTADMQGYALVYEVAYPVLGGAAEGGWDETIARGAAAGNVTEDVRLLLNHEGVPLARTRSGTMQLVSDRVGLRVIADGLDLRNPDVQRLVSTTERRDLAEMSFLFLVGRDAWNADFTRRRILSFAQILEVSPVTFPANPNTSLMVHVPQPMTVALARTIRGRELLTEPMTVALARAIRDRELLADVA